MGSSITSSSITEASNEEEEEKCGLIHLENLWHKEEESTRTRDKDYEEKREEEENKVSKGAFTFVSTFNFIFNDLVY